MAKTEQLYRPLGWLLAALGVVTVGLGVGGEHVGLSTSLLSACAGLQVAIAGIVVVLCGWKSEQGKLNVWTLALTLIATVISVTALVLNFRTQVCTDPPSWTENITGYHQEYDGAIRNIVHGSKYQLTTGDPNSSVPKAKYGIACERQTLSASCPTGKVIRIVSALYGRTQPAAVCAGPVYTTQCRSTTSLTVVRGHCDGQQSCSLTASNSEFGDPCVGTFKYLEIEYECTGAKFEPVQVERLGCWTDTADRAIPPVEGSDPRLDGPYQLRQRAIQKCQAVAQSRNLNVFAIQNGGWCAASAEAENTYKMYGPSGACRDDGKGGPWANEVYKIIHGGSLRKELVCEHQTAYLRCPDGQQIRVVSASYGRTTSEAVCGGPVHTTECRSDTSLSVVQAECDTHQSCAVSAENSLFGDPCVGTFKYLEAHYECIPKPDPPRYLGCYEDHQERVFPSDRMDSGEMTSDICIQHCLVHGHQYAATQYAQECWCGSHDDFLRIGVRRPDSECDLPCPGRSTEGEMCGGTWRMSVYRAGRLEAPTPPRPILTAGSQLQRLGCWGDTADRAVPTLEGTDPLLDGHYRSRTDAIRKCQDTAARRGWTVFAVQNGGWCAASANALQTYRKYGQSDACRVDGEGGPWANEVYRIVTSPQLQPGLVCEHSTMSIQCPSHKVIHIQSAMYGRVSGSSVCGTVYNGTPCKSSTSLSVLQARCDGREACSVEANNGVFGDPCYGTFKYLAVEYECVGVPGYKGCYEDTESRKFPADLLLSEKMTTVMCVQHCKANGHAYAGTQYSRECRCGSEHHFNGLDNPRPETECNKPCPGNPDQWCGGTWRMSVYGVQNLDVCETPSTDTQYRYRWDQLRLAGSRFTFEVQADNDAHVALSSQNQDLDDMYEIVIGGWANTQSVIRRSKQGYNHVKAATPGINSPTEYRTFWITWSSDGTIAVGRGGETVPFMEWTDPDPLPIAYAGYSTGWGSTGRWKFCHTASAGPAETGAQSAVEAPRKNSNCTPCRQIAFFLKISTSIMVSLCLLACLLAYLGYRRSGSYIKKSEVIDRSAVKLPPLPDIFSISTAPPAGPTNGVVPQGPDVAEPGTPPPPYPQEDPPRYEATADA